MSFRRLHPYGKARLWLGISNIGFWVLFATFALTFDLSGHFFPTEPLVGKKLLLSLGTFLAGYVILQIPFDLLGGYVIPLYYRRYFGSFSDFIMGWLRGVILQSGVLLGIGVALLRWPDYLLWVGLACMVVLLLIQLPLARFIGRFESRGDNAWKSDDDAFTGGIGGLPGMQKAIFVTGRGQRIRLMDERRRAALQKMHLPVAGLVIAMAFNLVGLLLVSSVVGHPLDSVSGLVELSLGFTLWSFLGLLTLPSVSRPAVFAADYALYAKGVTESEFESYLRFELDHAGEAEHSPWSERIFYPVPSPGNRLAHWGRQPPWTGAWHAARYALFLSWSGLSLLNRSVHCNIGKPNVWVLLPCD